MARNYRTSKDLTDLQRIRDRLMLTVGFLEGVQDFPSAAQIRTIIESAASKEDLRSLRLLEKEIDAMTVSLAEHERDGLEALLKHRLGVDKDAERAKLHLEVAIILKRGTVRSERERLRLQEYADMLEAVGGDAAEVAAVRRLTAASQTVERGAVARNKLEYIAES